MVNITVINLLDFFNFPLYFLNFNFTNLLLNIINTRTIICAIILCVMHDQGKYGFIFVYNNINNNDFAKNYSFDVTLIEIYKNAELSILKKSI